MNDDSIIKNSLTEIVKEKKNPNPKLKKFLDENCWPMRLSKADAIKAIDYLLEAKLPVINPLTDLLDISVGISKKMPKLNAKQKQYLEEMKEIITEAKFKKCDHDIGIAPFMHGGGFSPTVAYPEIICKKCGLNVTLHPGRQPVDIGLKMALKSCKELRKWVDECFEDPKKNVHSANRITPNPIKAYEESNQWEGDIPTVENAEKLESMSGQ